MSLSGAMNVGVTGLSSNAEAVTVVGNNIANVNTIGFKEGRTLFSDMLSSNISAGQVGRGTQIQAVQNSFSQGSTENTTSGNDLAIQGDAMFIVQDTSGSQYFTRAGAFDYDKSNVLTNPDGLQVMGYGINAATGLQNGVLGTIDKTAFATLPPKTTTSTSFVMNLDATATTPNSSPTSSASLTGDFGLVGVTNAVSLTAAGAATTNATSLLTIVDANGVTHPAVINTMTVPAAAAQDLTITVNGQTTTIGTYTTLGGNITALTFNGAPVAVAAGVTQPITFTKGAVFAAAIAGAGAAPGLTTGAGTGNTIPANSSVTFYDEFGNAQTAAITWSATNPTNYTYSISIPNAIAGTPGGTGTPITGSLSFPTPTSTSVTATVALSNDAKPMSLTFDFSSITDTATATAPTATANGAPISTGTVMLSGGTITAPASIALTGGGAGGSSVVTDASGASITLNTALTNTSTITLTGGGAGVTTTAFDKAGTAFAVSVKPANTNAITLSGGGAGVATTAFDTAGTAFAVSVKPANTNAITLSGGGAGVATTAFDTAGTAYAVAVKPANTNAVALSGGGGGLATTVFGTTGTTHALAFSFAGGTVSMTVDGGAPAAVGIYTDDGTNFTSAVTWTTPQVIDGASIALSDTLNGTALVGATTATSAGDISNFVGAAAAVKNGVYAANATTITAADVSTTANILIGAGATQATATLSDAGIVGGLLAAASTVTSAGDISNFVGGAAAVKNGVYAANATNITSADVSTTANILIGAGATQATATLDDSGMNGLLSLASTVVSGGSLGYSTAGVGVPFTAFGTYSADATTITASTVAAGTTITTGASSPLITASALTGGLLAAATSLTTVPASNGTFVDSAGIPHAMTISFPTATTWQADIVGATPATSTITGIFNSAASTWTQSSSTVIIGGVPQTVVFDLSNVATGATATAVSANGWNKADPSLTSNFQNSTQVYDSQGNAHTATVYYSKTGGNTWDYHLLVPDALSINGMAGNNVLNGTMTFSPNGILLAQTPSNTSGVVVQFPGGVASQSITLDFNPNLSTQMASSSIVSSQSQNGYATGKLMSTKIDDNGYVSATYSNNQNQRIAQIALARFPSMGGLEKSGNSLYINTAKSGVPLPGTATDFGIKVLANSLEQSNVDMATQLVAMIKLQRAYSGNSKTITSSDEMMQETLSLKR